MSRLSRLTERWNNVPAAVAVAVALLLVAGFGVIALNESAYRSNQAQDTRVQAEILAASVAAALDFGDAPAAQEAVEAIRVNRRVRTVGVYSAEGALVAGYARGDAEPPPTLDRPERFAAEPRAATVPVTSGSERIGTVYLAVDAEPLSRRLTRYFLIGLLVVMAALVVAVLGLAQIALRRVNRQLEQRAEALAAANAELKVQIGERARAEDELRQAQKLQALGQLTGGIAHDFNNLLTVIQGSADMLLRSGGDPSKRVRFAEAIVQASARAAALTGQLLAFARRQPLRPEVVDVNALIGGMTDLLDRTLGERIAVVTELAPDSCSVEVDPAQLESALLNVAVNARDAMPEGGELRISTSLSDGTGGEPRQVRIAIADSGLGMNDETLRRAIEPFFTTKAAGKGTGLGLSQVYGFATQSGGDVHISSAEGKGTVVTLSLPCSAAAAPRAGEERPRALGPRRTGRVLLVEDNEEVGEFAETLLGELGYEVVRATDGARALALVRRIDFDAVFTDVVMPGMSGLDLAEEIDRLKPGMPVILTTGYSDVIAESGSGGRPVILKPYRLETLAATLDQVIEAAPR